MSSSLTYTPYLYAFKFKGKVVYSYKYFEKQGLLVFYDLGGSIVYSQFISFEIFWRMYYYKDKQVEFETIGCEYGEELYYYKCYDKQGAV